MVKNLNDFWFQLFRQELNELWCLLIWFTWTIVNAYWFIGPLQFLLLKEHQWQLDIQYSSQDIDERLKCLMLVHFNSLLWHRKTQGHSPLRIIVHLLVKEKHKSTLIGITKITKRWWIILTYKWIKDSNNNKEINNLLIEMNMRMMIINYQRQEVKIHNLG